MCFNIACFHSLNIVVSLFTNLMLLLHFLIEVLHQIVLILIISFCDCIVSTIVEYSFIGKIRP